MQNEHPTEFKLGEIIISKAGRDSGRYFVVMWDKDEYIGLCDGDLRKTDSIKKKKKKHVKKIGKVCEYLNGKLMDAAKVTNSEVRRSIAEYTADIN